MFFPTMLSLLAQTAPVETEVLGSSDQGIFSLLLHANGVVQLTLLLLVGFSVVSWAIIGSKHRQLKRIKKRAAQFYDLFWEANTVEDLAQQKKLRASPPSNVFRSAIETLRKDGHDKKHALMLLEREVRKRVDDEVEEMEYGVPFLATTGSAAPFIGLFGTVWGILNAFWKIGRTGASSLAIVGPHIAEALIATAIGLAAAIPAVIFYNIYVNRIRLLAKDLQDFSDDLLVKVQREYFAN